MPAASLRRLPRHAAGKGRIREGLRYVEVRPDIIVMLVAVFIVGTFGLNFSCSSRRMVGTEVPPGRRRVRPHRTRSWPSAPWPGHCCPPAAGSPGCGSCWSPLAGLRRDLRGIAALAPSYFWFGVALVPVGPRRDHHDDQRQRDTCRHDVDPQMRGRVMALYMAIFMGGTPLGAPLDRLGGARRRPALVRSGGRGGHPACSVRP